MYGYDVFHENIIKEIINTIKNGTSKHAYLFVGAEGVGKRVAARLVANAFACENKEYTPCTKCRACVGAKADTNPDIQYIRPTDKKSITVEQAREIIASAYVKPMESEKKVYIIEDASLLGDATQNCLLKILEEPPEYVVFIIISSSESFLLQTVLSRCTTVYFPSVDDNTLNDYIKKNYPDDIEKSELLISLSQGIPGEIDKILNDPDYDDIRHQSFKNLVPLLSRHKISAYKIAEFLENNKDRAEEILDFWQSFLRDIMVIKNSDERLVKNIDLQEDLKNLSNRMNDNIPIVALEQLILAKTMLKRYVNLHVLALHLSFSIKNRLYG